MDQRIKWLGLFAYQIIRSIDVIIIVPVARTHAALSTSERATLDWPDASAFRADTDNLSCSWSIIYQLDSTDYSEKQVFDSFSILRYRHTYKMAETFVYGFRFVYKRNATRANEPTSFSGPSGRDWPVSTALACPAAMPNISLFCPICKSKRCV